MTRSGRLLLWIAAVAVLWRVILPRVVGGDSMVLVYVLLAIVFVGACGYLILLLSIAIHELGHVLAGVATGMKMQFMQVGPISVSRASGSLRFSLMGRTHVGGLAVLHPTPGKEIHQYRWMILGGPAASVIQTIGAIAVFQATRPPQRGSVWDVLEGGIGYLALVLSITMLPGTLVPYVANGYPTDMKQLLTLRKAGPDRDRLIALLQIQREMKDHRARDWSIDLIEMAVEPADGTTNEQRGRYLAFWHFFDKGDRDRARQELERGASIVKERNRKAGVIGHALLFELATLHSLEGNPEEAESILKSISEPSGFIESSHLRAQAALKMSKGACDEALELLQKAEEKLDQSRLRMASNVDAERELLRTIRDRCAAGVNS